MGANAGQKQVRAGISGDCELPDVVIEKVPRSSGRETSALNIVSDNQFFTIVQNMVKFCLVASLLLDKW